MAEMSEFQIYDALGRARFGNKPRPWLARYVLGLPSNEAFHAQRFRHELGHIIVHEHGIPMPDINVALREFHTAGMVTPISPVEQQKQEFLGIINPGWIPYAEFLGQHLVTQGLVEEVPTFHLVPSE